MLIVKKFGGTSVGSIDKIKNIANKLKELHKQDVQLVVVVSAMGDTTDHLVKLAAEVSDKPNPREYDALISTGENVSASLLSMCLIEKGVPAVSLTGGQAGILTESRHMKAKVRSVNTDRIKQELDQNRIVIVTGFQGLTEDNNVTTIGRGGSDTSAVILAAALNAKECDIYTDVDGVYTTDPRIEPKASRLDEISHNEMLELAQAGAQVLHPRAVECAKLNGITIHVRSSFTFEEGTRVKEINTMETQNPVTGIAVKKDEAKLSLISVPDSPGIAASLFKSLAHEHINVDMIIQSTETNGSNTITFTVDQSDLKDATQILESLKQTIGAKDVTFKGNMAKVSIVGVGMISQPGVAAKMFDTLGQNGINIDLISTSEIKVSCAIPVEDADKAVKLLHDAFELERVPAPSTLS